MKVRRSESPDGGASLGLPLDIGRAIRTKVALVTGAIALVCLALYSEYWLGIVKSHEWAGDYRIYYDAVLVAASGANPYKPNGFLYHPFAAIFLSPTTALGPAAGSIVWASASIAAWVVSVVVAIRLTDLASRATQVPTQRGRRLVYAVSVTVALLFAPFLETIHIGQINAFVLLFLLLSLYLSERGLDIGSGVALAGAVVLKTSPALFLAYFLFTRRYRTVMAAVVTLAIATVVPSIAYYPSIARDYLLTVAYLGADVHPTHYNETLLTVILLALTSLVGSTDRFVSPLKLASSFGFVLAMVASGVTPLFGFARSAASRIWLFALLTVLMVMSSPLVWYHHNLLLLLPLMLLIASPNKWKVALGVGAVYLIQTNRLFEEMVIWIGIPDAIAQLLVLMAVAISYLQCARQHPGLAAARAGR